MGNGALLAYQLIPANRRNLQQSPVPGPNAVLVRARDGDGVAFRRMDGGSGRVWT